jgi:hypothetical protein
MRFACRALQWWWWRPGRSELTGVWPEMSRPLLDPAKDLEKQEFNLCQGSRCKSVTHLNSALDGDENIKESGDSL